MGFFPVASPFASDAGISALTGKRDPAAAKAALTASGHAGAPVTALHATDVVQQNVLMAVAVDLMGKAGLKVDNVVVDFATLVQRRAKKGAGNGSWNALIALFGGTDLVTPRAISSCAATDRMRGSAGRPDAPRLESLRDNWLDAPDPAVQKSIARAIQEQALQDLPYIPLGQFFCSNAYRPDMKGVRNGTVLPLNAALG